MHLIAHFARPFAVLVILAGAAGCRETRPDVPPLPPVTVQTAAVQSIDVAERLEAGGVVAASRTATLSSRIVAPVRELRVRAGDRVRTGQVLVLLDARDLVATASQASASAGAAHQGLAASRTELDAATSDHKLAASWHQRISALHAKDSATTQELDEAEARLAGATARLAGAKARLEQAGSAAAASRAGANAAETVREFATIVAPFDGVVTETFTDPGNLASPGVPLLRVDGAGPRQVDVLVDERRVPFVNVGDQVDVLIAAEPKSVRTSTVKGAVAEVGREMSGGQRAFKVKVALPGDVDLRTGTFARVRFAGTSRTALIVPDAAIVRQGQVASVFVVRDGMARLRVLHTGETLPEGTEVLAGLDAGEQVVIGPPSGLADGRAVAAASPGGERR